MVKIYLKDKNEYLNVEYSSIMKAYFIGWIGLHWYVKGWQIFERGYFLG